MKQYLVLLKGKKVLDYSPEQLQNRLEEYRAWLETIAPHYVSDSRLERFGSHIKDKNVIQTDGPFLESKEIIAGFIILKANDLDQAVKVANTSPLLAHFEMLVRPIVSFEES